MCNTFYPMSCLGKEQNVHFSWLDGSWSAALHQPSFHFVFQICLQLVPRHNRSKVTTVQIAVYLSDFTHVEKKTSDNLHDTVYGLNVRSY